MPKEQIGVLIEPELKKTVMDQLEYSDSMSEWVRQAIVEKLEREELIDEEGV